VLDLIYHVVRECVAGGEFSFQVPRSIVHTAIMICAEISAGICAQLLIRCPVTARVPVLPQILMSQNPGAFTTEKSIYGVLLRICTCSTSCTSWVM
jgi:hypothetical protein